jgi:aldose 1-epimerase
MVMKIRSSSKSPTQLFGELSNGSKVYSHEISNSNGMTLKVMDYGATVIALKKSLKNGKVVDVVLGFDALSDYVDSYSLPSAPYFGATVGRFAGRIANATFDLNGKSIVLHQNNSGNALHGGIEGFSQKLWRLEQLKTDKNPSVSFSYRSPAGEERYPGELKVSITYTLTEENELEIEYKATTNEPTVVNLTHHSYFNLEGQHSSVLKQELHIDAYEILETIDMISTGKMLPVQSTDWDYTAPKPCPEVIDTTFVIKAKESLAATLLSKENNLKMEVYTNQPGLHVYVGGNCFNQIKGKENASYHSQSGICFETQNFPDAPNHPNFPSAILLPGDIYFHKTIYKFQSF